MEGKGDKGAVAARFGALLRRLRLEAMLTQQQLGERSGVSVRAISRFEAGQAGDPRMSTVRLLADALGLPPDEHSRLLATAVGDRATPPDMLPSTRNDLPGDIADFTGRADEISQLLASVGVDNAGQTAVVIGAVDGMAGVGKTTLAVHVAHRLAERYPDAQLYIDLHGHTDAREAVDPAAALDALLRALGLSGDQLPDGLDQRAARWRAGLAGRKALVVLDNVADAAQVRPLLPGSPGCLVLITSRRRLTDLDTARTLSLDVLPAEDAIALFTGIAGADRGAAHQQAVAELVQLCGHLPLAIRIAAARLRSRPAWALEHLAGRLREGQRALAELSTGDRSVTATFTLSYQHLTPQQQHLFRLLGLHPGPDIDPQAAASLIGRNVIETERLLEDLVDVHLLQQPAPGRYRLHDLLRHHAHHTAQTHEPEQAQQQALTRLTDHYLHTAHTAAGLLATHRDPISIGPPAPGSRPHPLQDNQAAALKWFTAEHANLLATQQVASQRGWHTPVWQLAWALDTFHYRKGHLHDHLAVWRAGLAAANQLGDPATHTRAHRLLGLAYARAGQHTEAMRHLHQALTQAEHANNAPTQAHIHHNLAWVWEQQGDHQRALEHATHAFRLYHAVPRPVQQSHALNKVGWYHARLGHHDQARTRCEDALTLARHHHSREGEADTLDSLGYIAHRTGRHTHALRYYQQALTLYRDLGNTYEEANTLAKLANTHHTLNHHDQARHTWHQAQQLYQHQGRQQDTERLQQQLDALPPHVPLGQ